MMGAPGTYRAYEARSPQPFFTAAAAPAAPAASAATVFQPSVKAYANLAHLERQASVANDAPFAAYSSPPAASAAAAAGVSEFEFDFTDYDAYAGNGNSNSNNNSNGNAQRNTSLNTTPDYINLADPFLGDPTLWLDPLAEQQPQQQQQQQPQLGDPTLWLDLFADQQPQPQPQPQQQRQRQQARSPWRRPSYPSPTPPQPRNTLLFTGTSGTRQQTGHLTPPAALAPGGGGSSGGSGFGFGLDGAGGGGAGGGFDLFSNQW